jgi:hypothetical protein
VLIVPLQEDIDLSLIDEVQGSVLAESPSFRKYELLGVDEALLQYVA